MLWVDDQRTIVFNTRVPLGTALPPLPQPTGRSALAGAVREGRPTVGDRVDSQVEGLPLLPVVALAVPVRMKGRPASALVAVVPVSELQAQLERWKLPATAIVALEDGTGQVLARRSAAQAPESPEPQAILGTVRYTLPSAPWTLVVALDGSAIRAAWAREALQALALLGVVSLGIGYAVRRGGTRLQREIASLAGPAAATAPAASAVVEVVQVHERLSQLAAERAAALSQAQDSHTQLMQLLSAFRQPVWISVNDSIVFANRATQRLLGAQEAHILGRSVLDFVEPTHAPRGAGADAARALGRGRGHLRRHGLSTGGA